MNKTLTDSVVISPKPSFLDDKIQKLFDITYMLETVVKLQLVKSIFSVTEKLSLKESVEFWKKMEK